MCLQFLFVVGDDQPQGVCFHVRFTLISFQFRNRQDIDNLLTTFTYMSSRSFPEIILKASNAEKLDYLSNYHTYTRII